MSSPTCTCWVRRSAGASCRFRPSWLIRTCSGCCKPGQHGSTFGGNPLACAVGSRGRRPAAAPVSTRSGLLELGAQLRDRLEPLIGHGVVGVRCRGLWAGVDIDPTAGQRPRLCEALARRGVLAKDTHGSTIRLAPPIVITEAQLDHGLDQLELSLADLARH